MTILKRLISSNLRVALLAHYYSRPEESFHVRRLENILKEPASNIGVELKNLERAGILNSRKVGNQKHYSLCRENPLYHELRMMFLKTTGVGEEIRRTLAGMTGVALAFIFGSFAKGDAGISSDVDLALVGDISEKILAPLVAKIEKKIGREINYHVWTRRDAETQMGQAGDFLFEIFTGPRVLLVGRKDDRLFQTGKST